MIPIDPQQMSDQEFFEMCHQQLLGECPSKSSILEFHRQLDLHLFSKEQAAIVVLSALLDLPSDTNVEKRESEQESQKKHRNEKNQWIENTTKLNKEINRLHKDLKGRDQLAKSSAEMMQNLRTVEIRLHNVHHTAAIKLGTQFCRIIRASRSSFFGKSFFWLLALVTLNLKNHRFVREQISIAGRSGLFDEAFYIKTYPLMAYSDKTPLEHYILHGEREGRQPNAVFRPYHYSPQMGDSENVWGSPLVHFIMQGAYLNLDPSPFFSTKLYKEKHELGSEHPLAHYLRKNPESADQDPSHADELDDHGTNNEPDRVKDEINWLMREVDALSTNDKISRLLFATPSNPKISILIPFFNKLEYTVNCLYALQKQSYRNFEVILVDDASTESGCKALANIEGVQLIGNPVNKGYLLSCNLAAEQSKGDYIVQLNNDTLPLERWLEQLLETFEYYPNAGVVGSMMLDQEGKIQEAGGVIFQDASGYNYGRGVHHNAARFNYCRRVDYCSGASIMIPKTIWDQVGGYDLRFVPAYYEDTDFAMQVRELGFEVIYNPHSKLVHYEGISSGISVESGVKKYQAVNQTKFYKKWTAQLDQQPSVHEPEEIDRCVRAQVKKGWILWLDSTTPTPDKDSGSIDTVNFFEQALSDGWGVTFMPWDGVRHEGKYTQNLQYLGVECIYGRSKSPTSYLQLLTDDYDIVVVSRFTVAKYAYPIIRERFPKAKIVFNTVDLHFLRYEREDELQKHLGVSDNVSVAPRTPERGETKSQELSLVTDCDATIVVSEAEAGLLTELTPKANVWLIPLFRNVVGGTASFEKRVNIGFIGGYQHPPNVDAVRYFVNDVWPLVRKKLPDARFVIAGSNMPLEINSLASDDIEIRGYVEDVADLFEEVRLMVAPLRYGAGMKGKVVSALCHGVPQVVTEMAAEGMGLKHNATALIADDAAAFANYVVELYSDQALWEGLSEAGVEKAKNEFSKDSVAKNISKLLDELAANK